jgi:hypothetical protein
VTAAMWILMIVMSILTVLMARDVAIDMADQ